MQQYRDSAIGYPVLYYTDAPCMQSIALLIIYILLLIHNIVIMQLLQAKSCFFLAALVFGAAKSLIGIGQFTLPLSFKKPPISPIVTMHTFCSGGILALDVHPTKRYVHVSKVFRNILYWNA